MAKGTYAPCPEYALGEQYTPERAADFRRGATPTLKDTPSAIGQSSANGVFGKDSEMIGRK